MYMNKEIEELNRQIAMGWKRGRDFGLVVGIISTLVFGLVIKLIW